MKCETITAAQNPKVKMLLSLMEKPKARREAGLFVVEGRRELLYCIGSGYRVRTLFSCPEIISDCEAEEMCGEDCTLIHVPATLYERIAYRGSTEGVIAEVEMRDRGLDDIVLRDRPIVVALEAVEKPGNLGAVLRTADAADVDAVIVCDPQTDLYNPNLIRASIGAVFTRQVVATTSADAIRWLKANGLKIYSAQLQDSSLYYDIDMKCGIALVMGSEDKGLTDVWRANADARVRIPMLGRLDSLNVSVSAAILMSEAVRQRHSGGRELR